MTLELAAGNALFVLGLVFTLWQWSLVRRDASVIDPWWSMGFLLVAVRSVAVTGVTSGKLLLLACVTLWALRLWLHLLVRARGKPEDPRYQRFRRHFGAERYWWVSFFQVFLLQGALLLLVSAPLALAGAAHAPDRPRWNDALGAAIFAVGWLIESIADAQLTRFRATERSGRVLDRGLWRYSRHPNYFGETLVMWGFWLMGLDAPGGGYAVFAPVLMTFMLLRVSGVTMLEQQLRRSKPEYAEYVRRTSAFVPLPPRR